MNNQSLKHWLKVVKNFWGSKKGYEEWPKAGLCPDSSIFRSTFNPSATHVQIYDILKGDQPWQHSGYFVVEPVYRHIDIGAVSDRSHLSLFYMLGVVKLVSPNLSSRELEHSRSEFVADVMIFLNTFNLTSESMIATYFRGGYLLDMNLPADSELKSLFLSIGLPLSNVIGMGGAFAFLYSPESRVDVAGSRSDFYFKGSDNTLLEIATLDFAEYLTCKGSKLRKNDKFILFGFYTGIERLIATQVDGDVWKTHDLEILLNQCFELLLTKYHYSDGVYLPKIMERDVKIFVDRLRAIYHIMAAGQVPDNSNRGQMLKRLLQDAVRFCHNYIGRVDTEILFAILSAIGRVDELEPSLTNKISDVIVKSARK